MHIHLRQELSPLKRQMHLQPKINPNQQSLPIMPTELITKQVKDPV